MWLFNQINNSNMKKYFAAACLLFLFSCNAASEKQAADTGDSTETQTASTDSSTVVLEDPKVQAIYNDYIGLKTALVNSKFDEAKKTAAVLKSSLSTYAGCENTAIVADKIVNSKDIAAQRKEFTHLSNDVIAMFKTADLKSGSIYVQHCPMANGGDGGDWLSSNKNIQNPYYGDEMLECGAVLQEIKK